MASTTHWRHIYEENNMRKVVMLLLMLVACSVLAVPAFAQGSESAAAGTNWVAITSGFAMAFAAALAALGQSRVASAACEGLARNPAARPGIQLALILGLAFIESLVLFTFLIIFVKVVR
jgi:F-type H+-transporting ATPase subunit c